MRRPSLTTYITLITPPGLTIHALRTEKGRELKLEDAGSTSFRPSAHPHYIGAALRGLGLLRDKTILLPLHSAKQKKARIHTRHLLRRDATKQDWDDDAFADCIIP